jgi:hypothetical protein
MQLFVIAKNLLYRAQLDAFHRDTAAMRGADSIVRSAINQFGARVLGALKTDIEQGTPQAVARTRWYSTSIDQQQRKQNDHLNKVHSRTLQLQVLIVVTPALDRA